MAKGCYINVLNNNNNNNNNNITYGVLQLLLNYVVCCSVCKWKLNHAEDDDGWTDGQTDGRTDGRTGKTRSAAIERPHNSQLLVSFF